MRVSNIKHAYENADRACRREKQDLWKIGIQGGGWVHSSKLEVSQYLEERALPYAIEAHAEFTNTIH